MKILIALEMYDTDEICRTLPQYTRKKETYSQQRVQVLIKQHLPMAEKIGNRYLLTERQIKWLATKIKDKKRPNIY